MKLFSTKDEWKDTLNPGNVIGWIAAIIAFVITKYYLLPPETNIVVSILIGTFAMTVARTIVIWLVQTKNGPHLRPILFVIGLILLVEIIWLTS